MYMECFKFTNYTPCTFVDDIFKLSIFECYKFTNNKPAILWLKYCRYGLNCIQSINLPIINASVKGGFVIHIVLIIKEI